MKSLLCLVLALPLVLSSDTESAIAGLKYKKDKKRITNSLTAQNEALKQENSNLMLQIEQAIGESEVAGHGRRRVRTCSRNWFWGLLCCKRCCGGFWAEHDALRPWCNFDKYMCPYNDQNAHLANCDSAESEVGDDMSQYLDSGNQDSENPCNNPVASRCCSTCTTNPPDTEECDVFNLDMCPTAAAEKGLTAQNKALKQANSNLMQQIEQAIGDPEGAGNPCDTYLKQTCCSACTPQPDINPWCDMMKHYNGALNCPAVAADNAECSDNPNQWMIDHGKTCDDLERHNQCEDPDWAPYCQMTCGYCNGDSESAIAGPKYPRHKKRITNSLTAQNKALKQANSNLMQKIEQAIGESEVAGHGRRRVISCGGFWGLFCCEDCCGGVAKHIPGVCNFDKYMCPYNDQQAHLSNCAESEVGNDMSQLFDSGNQDSENPCDNPIASICCSTCTTNPDPECDLVNFDFNCPAAAAEMESLAFSSVNSFEQGAMLVLASIGLVSSALFVRQCIFSKSKYDQVTDAHAEEI